MTKIEWTDFTWNPAWGCLNNCEYCYARSIAKRFGKTEDQRKFIPTWMENNFNKKFPKKPSRIFINSMSDIFYWKPEWMEKVLNKIKEYPQHTFQFLTKNSDVYFDYEFPENCWLGATITNDFEYQTDAYFGYDMSGKFLSIEPILEEVKVWEAELTEWIIVGAETGNRKNKIIPNKKWIEDIRKFCKKNNIPYFEKDSLIPIVNRKLIREFPK